MEIQYNSWYVRKKKKQSDSDTLFEMDTINGTKNEKKKLALEAAAREAHEKGIVYFALAIKDNEPFAFLEMNDGYFNVNFLDQKLRLFRMLVWNRGANGQVFLNKAQSWEFDGDSDEMMSSTIRIYFPDGQLKVEKTLLPSRETTQEQFEVDVSSNWADHPAFGEYDAILDMSLVDWKEI